MGKFATKSRNSTIDPSVSKAYAVSTPLAKLLAEKIMSYYNPKQEGTELNDDEQNIQTVFDKFPNDDVTRRLAQLTVALTGYAPVVSGSPANFPIGSLFKNNGSVWCVAYT